MSAGKRPVAAGATADDEDDEDVVSEFGGSVLDESLVAGVERPADVFGRLHEVI